jgi:hypothetical protein
MYIFKNTDTMVIGFPAALASKDTESLMSNSDAGSDDEDAEKILNTKLPVVHESYDL